MRKKILYLLMMTLLVLTMVGCGTKTSLNDVESTENEVAKDSEDVLMEIINVEEDATTSESKDGSITVTTDSGEEIVVDKNSEKTQKKENADGSTTYTTEDGTEITINNDGSAVVEKEEEVPANTETPSNTTTEESHTHSYTATVTTPASCTSNGVKTYTCSCGSSYTKDIDKTAHVAGEWKTTKEATCTSDGTKVKNCSICGTNMESATITKLGHKEGSWEVTKNANCKMEGTKVKKCTTCGVQLKSETIAKTGHTTGDWIVTKEATCSTNGSKHKVCSVCGVETSVEAIAANGTHSYSWSINGDTRTMKCTCGATGITEYKYGEVWGYFDDAEAENLWYWINESRKATETIIRDPFGNIIGGTNVAALNKNDSLTTKAISRATEAALNFDHGEEEHECLAWGYGSGVEAYEAWCYSSGHAQAMTNPDYTIGGVAFFWYDSDGSGTNLTPIAVLELGY